MKRIFPYIVLLASLMLAAVAAWYSIFGLSKLFSSQATAVIIMASILETSKLISASYLHRYWSNISYLMRTYLIAAVFVLMSITSIGIYGFLVSSYQETALKLNSSDYQTEILNTRRDRYSEQIENIQNELNSITSDIANLTAGLSNNMQQYTDRNGNLVITSNSANRRAIQQQLDLIVSRRDTLIKSEAALYDSVTVIDMQLLESMVKNDVAAELGPLLYVSKLTGQELDVVVNWFILMFIFVFDPLAIILLLSANHALRSAKTTPIAPISDNVVIINEPQPDVTNDIPIDMDNISDEYFDTMPDFPSSKPSSTTLDDTISVKSPDPVSQPVPSNKYPKVIS